MTQVLTVAMAVPAGAWFFLGLHITLDGVLVLLAWLATRQVRPPAPEFEVPSQELPFGESVYIPPVSAGNPIWRTLLYFVLTAVAVLGLGYSLMSFFGA